MALLETNQHHQTLGEWSERPFFFLFFFSLFTIPLSLLVCIGCKFIRGISRTTCKVSGWNKETWCKLLVDVTSALDSGTAWIDEEDSNVPVMDRCELWTNGDGGDDMGDICGAEEHELGELLSVVDVSEREVSWEAGKTTKLVFVIIGKEDDVLDITWDVYGGLECMVA